jgi:hypothetical protein
MVAIRRASVLLSAGNEARAVYWHSPSWPSTIDTDGPKTITTPPTLASAEVETKDRFLWVMEDCHGPKLINRRI